MKKILFLNLLVVVTLIVCAQTPAFITDSIDSHIKRGMTRWEIPGLAIAIVKDGKTIFMKGYGTREIGVSAPVDENTLFIIASNTKLFTGTALAKLDVEKKLSLEDKVIKHIPWFRLYDSTTTPLVTIRDVLTHRLGTRTFQGDFTFWDSNLPKDSIVWKMRYLKPSQQFRQDYGYCNAGFLVAGQVLSKVTGSSWENYVQENFLAPLQMNNTFMNTAKLGDRENLALPYNNLYTPIQQVPFDQIDNLGPATSMVSCVKDLARWIQFQLDSGKVNGTSLVPFSVLQKTRDINTILGSRKSPYYPSHFRGYGLGTITTDYNGKQVFWHTGGAMGYVTNVCFVPEENLGITILTNNDNQSFFEALRYQILDAYLGVPYQDRSQLMWSFFEQGKKQTEQELKAMDVKVKAGTRPPLPLQKYAGLYENTLYGNLFIAPDGNNLKVMFGNHTGMTATLEYMNNNEFRMTYSNIGFGVVPIKFNVTDNKVVSIEIKCNDFVDYDSYLFLKKKNE